MSDQTKAKRLLSGAIAICDAALDAISDRRDPPSPSPSLRVLLNDFSSLLMLLYASVTKLSLTLKPKSPTYSAALTPLQDISIHIPALAHCVEMFGDQFGQTLRREIIFTSRDIIESIRSLLRTFSDPSTRSVTSEEYLVKTGTVHSLIDNARSPAGTSADNLAAVRKRLAQDQESLADGLNELQEMIEESKSPQEAEDPLEMDDGWDALGLPSSKKMSDIELERANRAYAILRFTVAMHKRVLSHLLPIPSSSSASALTNAQLDEFPPLSTALLEAADELISTLDSPQQPAIMVSELRAFENTMRSLSIHILSCFDQPTLDAQMAGLTIPESKSSQVSKGSKKWFDTCFDQIQKGIQGLQSQLGDLTTT